MYNRSKLLESMNIGGNEINFKEAPNVFSSFYDAKEKDRKAEIWVPKDAPVGIVSHELGHHKMYSDDTYKNILSPLRLIGDIGISSSIAAKIMGRPLNKKQTIVASLSMVPTIFDEIAASTLGTKGMYNYYNKDVGEVAPQTGLQALALSTYVGTGLIPLLISKFKK